MFAGLHECSRFPSTKLICCQVALWKKEDEEEGGEREREREKQSKPNT
jgi:hypothetical protein